MGIKRQVNDVLYYGMYYARKGFIKLLPSCALVAITFLFIYAAMLRIHNPIASVGVFAVAFIGSCILTGYWD